MGSERSWCLVVLVPALVLATRRHIFRMLLKILQQGRAVAIALRVKDGGVMKKVVKSKGGARGEEKASCAKV